MIDAKRMTKCAAPMLAALLRFHLHVGARLAVRTFVPVLVAAAAGRWVAAEELRQPARRTP
ncbi:MAG TPA: hypothetical protein VH988_14530 [Thermoanaerobaculia bacterium]|jgi:hypothetical protein|nr:hypothetical protein [Thermoanaerobaculia bacterium]